SRTHITERCRPATVRPEAPSSGSRCRCSRRAHRPFSGRPQALRLSFRSMQLPERLTRGRLLGLAALGAAGAAWPVEDAAAGPHAVASGAVTCVLAPELTEGPYYVPNEAIRRNITEGKPGTPLRLHLTVVST